MKIKNLTPHEITFVKWEEKISLQSVGVARVSATTAEIGEIAGLPVFAETLGQITGLPEKEDGVILIVSRVVAEAANWRGDLYVPAQLLRDEKGAVIGCKGLLRPTPRI